MAEKFVLTKSNHSSIVVQLAAAAIRPCATARVSLNPSRPSVFASCVSPSNAEPLNAAACAKYGSACLISVIQLTSCAPELCPITVTFAASPPNLLISRCTHRKPSMSSERCHSTYPWAANTPYKFRLPLTPSCTPVGVCHAANADTR